MRRETVEERVELSVKETGNPDHRRRQKKPEGCVKQTDLSHEIVFEPAVIPDVPMGPEIDDTAGDKFHAGNDGRSDGASHPERRFFFQFFIGPVDEEKAGSSCEKHTPMRMPPPKELQQKIESAAAEEHQHRREDFFHKKHRLYEKYLRIAFFLSVVKITGNLGFFVKETGMFPKSGNYFSFPGNFLLTTEFQDDIINAMKVHF